MRQRIVIPIVAGLLFAGIPASATTVLRLPIEEMAARADLVIRAEVVRVVTVADPADERRLSTRVTVRVLESLKGYVTAPTLTITLLGGRTSRWTLAVPGTPVFREGSEVVLFLHSTPRGFKPAGLWLGKYEVRRDPVTGRARAVRERGPTAVIAEEGGRRFAEADAVSHADDELDLDDLVRRVRLGAKGGAR